jgi:hypothetical protein
MQWAICRGVNAELLTSSATAGIAAANDTTKEDTAHLFMIDP